MVSCGTVKTTLDVAPGDLGLSPLVAVSSSLVGMVGSVRLDHRAVESPVSLGQHFGIAPLQSKKPRADFSSALQRSSAGDRVSALLLPGWVISSPLWYRFLISETEHGQGLQSPRQCADPAGVSVPRQQALPRVRTDLPFFLACLVGVAVVLTELLTLF